MTAETRPAPCTPTWDTMAPAIHHPDRHVIDVTALLTPGAKAAAIERARVAATLSPGVLARYDDISPVMTSSQMQALVNHERDREEARLRAAFDGGRAYERGAAVRRRVGQSLARRQARALDVAREYLAEKDPRGAALVLAGFTGTEV